MRDCAVPGSTSRLDGVIGILTHSPASVEVLSIEVGTFCYGLQATPALSLKALQE